MLTATTTYVTATRWNVSYSSSSDNDYVTLRVFYIDDEAENQYGGHGVVVQHAEFYGKRFDSVDDAQAFAFEHGLLKVYERRF